MSTRYVVQAYCTGMGWVDVRGCSSESRDNARTMEKELRADDSRWVNTDTERRTRIVPKESGSGG